LPFEYRVGPGGTVARLKVDYDMATRPVHDVIARLPGRTLPDEWIIYGNHHDAWVNGAADPLSGASAVLETARVFGAMAKQGWRPKRTLIFALWDAEEYGIIGSTEWVERHAEELRQKAVVYVNSDTTGAGPFDAGGSPSLTTFTRELLRDFQDPRTEKPLLVKDFELGTLGAGSDYVPFAHHVGVPSLNYGFETDMSGVYHSTYDSLRWYTKFGDPDFTYLRLFTQMMATALARFSEASTPPFDSLATHGRLSRWLTEIRGLPGAKEWLKVEELEAALVELKRAPVGVGAPYLAERALLTPEGLPRRPWYKNVVSAPGLTTGYGAKTLPGIREAAEAGDWKEANEQVRVAARAIRAYARALGNR
jgi:N-acetylated-alpha-linked acidic dipeptidase